MVGFIAPQCYFLFCSPSPPPPLFFLFALFLSSPLPPFPRLTVPRITAHRFSIAYATNRFPVQFDSLCKARLFQEVALHCGNSCPNSIPTPHQCYEWKVRKLNSRFPSAVLRVDCVAAFFFFLRWSHFAAQVFALALFGVFLFLFSSILLLFNFASLWSPQTVTRVAGKVRRHKTLHSHVTRGKSP